MGVNEEAHHEDAGQACPARQIRRVEMLFLHVKMKERRASVQSSVKGRNIILTEQVYCICFSHL